MAKLTYDIKDLSLAQKGKRRIEWSDKHMPVLKLIGKRFSKEKPLNGVTIGACLHITAETANLLKILKKGGAKVLACASNPLSTQDDVAASLVKHEKIAVFAIRGENKKTYYSHIKSVLAAKPQITMDDGADLVNAVHQKVKAQKTSAGSVDPSKFKSKENKYFIERGWEMFGSSEETTTGVIRLKAMEKDGALRIPVMAVNDSATKHFFDNRYGTGQSTIDGILRATNILLAGKKFVICGYGWCGRGLAMRARGMGSEVIVTEVDPIRALEAVMDGFMVKPLLTAVETGMADIIVTVTGNKHVIRDKHFKKMKDGTILANSGHFNIEIDLESLDRMSDKKYRIREFVDAYEMKDGRTIYVLGEGRLINLVAAEGHPADVMDMSFADQALAAEWFVAQKGKLKPKVYTLPFALDKRVAQLKLKSMGVGIDRLTPEQKAYLKSWDEGT